MLLFLICLTMQLVGFAKCGGGDITCPIAVQDLSAQMKCMFQKQVFGHKRPQTECIEESLHAKVQIWCLTGRVACRWIHIGILGQLPADVDV